MAKLTLIGTRLAKEGQEFVYEGEATVCAECPYRTQCLNLVEEQKYRIVEVRPDAPLLECGVHDDGVVAVEVEPAGAQANIPSNQAYAGNKVALAGPCPYTGCPSHSFCEPDGIKFDQEYRIASVQGEPPHEFCMLDRELSLVELAPNITSRMHE